MDSKDLALVDNAIAVLNNLKLSIKTPKDAMRYMAASQRLSKLSKLIDDNVRKITSEIMYDEDLKMIEDEQVEIKYIQPTETDVYYPRSVIEALGVDRAVAFLQIKSGDLKKYIRKATVNGAMTMEELDKCNEHKSTSRKKGYIKVALKL